MHALEILGATTNCRDTLVGWHAGFMKPGLQPYVRDAWHKLLMMIGCAATYTTRATLGMVSPWFLVIVQLDAQIPFNIFIYSSLHVSSMSCSSSGETDCFTSYVTLGLFLTVQIPHHCMFTSADFELENVSWWSCMKIFTPVPFFGGRGGATLHIPQDTVDDLRIVTSNFYFILIPVPCIFYLQPMPC